MAFTQDLFTSYRSYNDGNTRIGEKNRIWYDSNTNTLRISDGTTPGGIIITGGGGSGGISLTNLSVGANGAATGGGHLAYNNSTGVFTFSPAELSSYATTTYVTNLLDNYNDLGNLSINGAHLQTISGSVNGADIVLNPNGGSIQVPSLKVSTFGQFLSTTIYVEAYITTYQLVNVISYSETTPLAIGTYGNSNGVAAPWTVLQLTPHTSGTSVSAIELNDVVSGMGIIPSTVVSRGVGGPGGGDTTTWDSYVIVNLDLNGLGQILPIPGAIIDLTRPLQKAGFDINTANNTDIFLNSQGTGDVIVKTNILPLITNMSNLGSPNQRWRELYLGPGTLYVLDETLGKDIAIGARDGNLYIQNANGLVVGNWMLRDNFIHLASPTDNAYIGLTADTGSLNINRPLNVVSGITGKTTFSATRDGLVKILSPSTILTTQSALSIIGSSDGSSQLRNFNGTLLHLTAQDDTPARVSIDAFGFGMYPVIAGRQAGGTSSTPTTTQSGDTLLRLTGQGYGITGYRGTIGRINIAASQTFTDIAAGTHIIFQTTPLNTTTIQSVSAIVDSTGLSLVGNSTGGITFNNNDRLTYFPTPVGNNGTVLASNGTTMSWQAAATFLGAVVYKGAWNAFTNTPVLSATLPTGLSSGWEYSIEATGTRDIGSGSTTYDIGGFVIYNGSDWEYIPPVSGVVSIQFDSGSSQTGVVQVHSSDIINTLDSGSIANIKLANSAVTVTAGTGLGGGGSISLGSSVALNNTGVISITSNSGLSTNVNATGNVTITNTGVLSVANGGHITATTLAGVVTLGSDATTNTTNNTLVLRNNEGGIDANDFTALLDVLIPTNHGPFNYGVLSYSDTSIMADFSYNTNNYNQIILQNRNSGNLASTNYLVSNDQGSTYYYYGEFGMNSSGFTGSGSINLPNAVYVTSISSDLVLSGINMHFVTNSSTSDALLIDSTGIATFTNTIHGSVNGTSGTTLSLSNHTTSDLTEGTNLYFTQAQARNSISVAGNLSYNTTTGVISYTTPTTDGITEGSTHLYFTPARAIASLSAGTGISYNNTTGVISSTITQYTDTMARSTLSSGTGISYNNITGVITSTITQYSDTMTRSAIGVSGSLSYNNSTGVISYTTPTYSVTTASASGGGSLSLSGTTFTFTPYLLPTASTNILGGVKVDGSTITITDGFISSSGTGAVIFKGTWNANTNVTSPGSYSIGDSLPTGVQAGWEYLVSTTGTRDIGNGIQTYTTGDLIIYDGTHWNDIPGSYTSPTYTVTTASNSGSGSLSLAGTTFTFTPPNLSSYITLASLSVTNAASSNSASSLSYANTTGTFTYTPFSLATASTSVLGGVKVDGTTINISSGIISAIHNGTVTSIATSGTVSGITLSGGTITSSGTIALGGSISGLTTSNLSATASIANSQLANSTISGIALGSSLYNLTAGTNVTFSSGTTYNGSSAITINVPTGAGYSYTLPAATTSALGGVIIPVVGTSGITNSSGNIGIATATASQLGGVKIDGITINISSGIISAVNNGTVTSITSSTLTVSGTSAIPTINLTSGIVVAGTTGSSSIIPVISYDTYGRITGITTAANPQGTVTSVALGTNNISGITLSGGPITSSGTISLSGSISGLTNSNLSGSAGITNTNLANSTISGVALGSSLYNLTAGTGVTFSSGTTYNGSAAITINAASNGIGGNQLVYVLNGSLSYASVKNTLVSIFGLSGGVALASNTRYQYEIVFNIASNKAGVLSYALTLNGGAVVAQHNYTFQGNVTNTIDGYTAGITMASFNATGAAITTANTIAKTDTFAHYVVFGTVDVTTGGNVNFMISQDQNTPLTWLVEAGAYIKLLPLGAIGANTVAGSWS